MPGINNLQGNQEENEPKAQPKGLPSESIPHPLSTWVEKDHPDVASLSSPNRRSQNSNITYTGRKNTYESRGLQLVSFKYGLFHLYSKTSKKMISLLLDPPKSAAFSLLLL